MAPFIKYTHVIQTQAGKRPRVRFINASQIAYADFNEETGVLEIVTTLKGSEASHELSGEEAIVALKVLQDLQG